MLTSLHQICEFLVPRYSGFYRMLDTENDGPAMLGGTTCRPEEKASRGLHSVGIIVAKLCILLGVCISGSEPNMFMFILRSSNPTSRSMKCFRAGAKVRDNRRVSVSMWTFSRSCRGLAWSPLPAAAIFMKIRGCFEMLVNFYLPTPLQRCFNILSLVRVTFFR